MVLTGGDLSFTARRGETLFCPKFSSLVCVCGSYIETGQVFPQVAGNEPQAVRLNYNHHYCQLYRHHCLYSYDCSHQNQFKVLAMIIHIVNIAIITSNLLLSSPLLTLSSTTRRWHHHCVATHCRLISKLHSSKSCFRIDTFSLIPVLSWRLFFLPTCSVGKPTTSFNILIRCTWCVCLEQVSTPGPSITDITSVIEPVRILCGTQSLLFPTS